MLDPHRLRVFRSVVASGSVQAAADNLGLTSSAVSQHLSALQRETGLTLFQRVGAASRPRSPGGGTGSPSAVGISSLRTQPLSPPRYSIVDVSGMPACELRG